MSKLRRIPEAKNEVSGGNFGVSRHADGGPDLPREPIRKRKLAAIPNQTPEWEEIAGATRAPHQPFLPTSSTDLEDNYSGHDLSANGIRRIDDGTTEEVGAMDHSSRLSLSMGQAPEDLNTLLREMGEKSNLEHDKTQAEEMKTVAAAKEASKRQEWANLHLVGREGERISASDIQPSRIVRTSTENLSASPFGMTDGDAMNERQEAKVRNIQAAEERKSKIQRSVQPEDERLANLFSVDKIRSQTMQRKSQEGTLMGNLEGLISS